MAFLRAFLRAAALVGMFVVGVPLQVGLAWLGPRVAGWTSVWFCRGLLRLLCLSIEVEGSIAEGPVLLAANHVSWIDVVALGSLQPFCFLAKREVASWPFLSKLAAVQGTVFINRRRRRDILPANRDLARRILEGRKVMLFPEGTTYDGRHPGRFLSSHFAAAREVLQLAPSVMAVSVQPGAIAYSSRAAAWIGDDALLPHVWRVLRGAPIRCLLVFGPPVISGAGSDRKAIAREMRETIAATLERARSARPAMDWTAGPTGECEMAHAAAKRPTLA